jgi:serine/threonine-protein kinase
MSPSGAGPPPPEARCPQCGAPNRRDARFCGVCGAATATTEQATGAGPVPGAASVIGREIAGRYRVLAKLGEGGMGAVFRAEQISLKRTVAVKLLRPDVTADPMLLRRFNAEAEVVAKLSHPGTVNIYDFGQDADGTLFIAMELIDGRSLRAVLQQEAPLALPRALAIATQIAASLADAHAHGIVHRDLKPDNVMLADRGRERDVVRVLDFGIAKLRDDTRATQMAMTQQGDMLGTPQYMAPEQIRAEAIDGRTDIYALGCLIYEMVTGRLPHDAATVLAMLSKHLLEAPVPPTHRRPDLGLPPAIDALVLGAMAKDPRARPPTMEGYGEQLAALLRSLPADPRSAQRSAVAPIAVPGGPDPLAATPLPGAMPPQLPTPPVMRPGAPVGHVGPMPPMPLQLPTPPAMRPGAPVGYLAPMQPPPGFPAPTWPGGAGPGRGAMAARSPRPLGLILALSGVAVVGITVAAVVVAGRDRPAASDRPAISYPPVAEVSGPDAGGAELPPRADPWAAPPIASTPPTPRPAATAHYDVPPAAGKKVAVGQGVWLVVPPGFRVSVNQGATLAFDPRGVVIAAGPIEGTSDDVQELSETYARATGLALENMGTAFVGGVQRQMAIFHGQLKGVEVREFGVPLIGRGYRIAVVFHAPVKLAADPAVRQLLLELWPRRIVLP